MSTTPRAALSSRRLIGSVLLALAPVFIWGIPVLAVAGFASLLGGITLIVSGGQRYVDGDARRTPGERLARARRLVMHGRNLLIGAAGILAVGLVFAPKDGNIMDPSSVNKMAFWAGTYIFIIPPLALVGIVVLVLGLSATASARKALTAEPTVAEMQPERN